MPTVYVYPTNAELHEVAQDKLPNLMRQRKIFDIMPAREVNDSVVMWEQKDNFIGLQQIRGYGGEGRRVKRVGGKRYMMAPGVYGEFQTIPEEELTRRRSWGTWADTIEITDLVMEAQDLLLQRELDRMEWIGWTLLSTGTFSVSSENGPVVHTDSFTPQTFSPTNAWSSLSNATPIADFRSLKLKHRGHSVSFGSVAKCYMNSQTANNILNNANANDLYGRRLAIGATINSTDDLNRFLVANDCPTIVEYDEGYLDDTGTFNLWIPNGYAILVGKRPAGQVVAEYQLTRNANNPGGQPGSYNKVVDNVDKDGPRQVNIHRGHNGGPAIPYPTAVISLSGL